MERPLGKRSFEGPPPSQFGLAESILIDQFGNGQPAARWETEIRRRVKDIEAGTEPGIAEEEVLQQACRRLNETRRLSSARPQ